MNTRGCSEFTQTYRMETRSEIPALDAALEVAQRPNEQQGGDIERISFENILRSQDVSVQPPPSKFSKRNKADRFWPAFGKSRYPVCPKSQYTSHSSNDQARRRYDFEHILLQSFPVEEIGHETLLASFEDILVS